MIVDYHMHLRAQVSAGSEPVELTAEAVERFVEVAAARGVDEIGFAEHDYYFLETREVWELPYQIERCRFGLDAYVGAIEEARRRGLPVRLGLEVDWLPGRTERLAELIEPYPWDFLLGSVHWLDGLPVDLEPGVWQEWPVETAWRRYFCELGKLARSGLVDVLAHPDLAKILGHRPAPELALDLYGAAAEAAAAGGVAIEISTAGLHKRVGELYPDPALLAACRALDVPITLASDAHVPSNVGRDFDAALALARRTGYETVTVFERRRARQEPLG